MASLIRHVLSLRGEDRAILREMVDGGFHHEQIALFATAPDSEARAALAKAWLNGVSRSEMASQVVERGSQLGAMVFLAGITSAALVATAGHLLSDPNWVETASILARYAPGVEDAFQHLVVDNVIGLSTVAWGVVGGTRALLQLASREPLEEQAASTLRLLSDRVLGVYVRNQTVTLIGQPIRSDRVLAELETVPAPYRNLLTHLDARELVLFLAADDEVRRQTLIRNPPSIKQRLDTATALSPRLTAGVSARMRLALTTWDSRHSAPGQVVMEHSLKALREARLSRSQAVVSRPPSPSA